MSFHLRCVLSPGPRTPISSQPPYDLDGSPPDRLDSLFPKVTNTLTGFWSFRIGNYISQLVDHCRTRYLGFSPVTVAHSSFNRSLFISAVVVDHPKTASLWLPVLRKSCGPHLTFVWIYARGTTTFEGCRHLEQVWSYWKTYLEIVSRVSANARVFLPLCLD